MRKALAKSVLPVLVAEVFDQVGVDVPVAEVSAQVVADVPVVAVFDRPAALDLEAGVSSCNQQHRPNRSSRALGPAPTAAG